MAVYNFTILIEQDEEGLFVAKVPDLPGCHTQAKDMPSLLKRVREAISLYLEVQKKENKPINQMKFIGVQQIEVTG
jgi:predicted RNase H-like HicB family nuclease